MGTQTIYNLKQMFCYFQLGLTDVFTINSDLGRITTQKGILTVSDIIHKAELEVNEKGGTASAATGTVKLLKLFYAMALLILSRSITDDTELLMNSIHQVLLEKLMVTQLIKKFPVTGSCKHGNETSRSIKGKFIG
jgi:hypothetical protein